MLPGKRPGICPPPPMRDFKSQKHQDPPRRGKKESVISTKKDTGTPSLSSTYVIPKQATGAAEASVGRRFRIARHALLLIDQQYCRGSCAWLIKAHGSRYARTFPYKTSQFLASILLSFLNSWLPVGFPLILNSGVLVWIWLHYTGRLCAEPDPARPAP